MSYLDECEAKAMSFTKEQRQAFLDLVWKGKTIKEAYTEAGIDFDAAFFIMNKAIEKKSYHTLNKEAV